jgi:hypothetical protein
MVGVGVQGPGQRLGGVWLVWDKVCEVGDEHRICGVRFWGFWRKVPLLSLHFPWGRAGTNVGENARL